MLSISPLARLEALQARLCEAIAAVDDETCRAQFHPALSPLGWHLRHCAFIEALWIREVAQGDASLTAPLHDLYLPWRAPKEMRGGQLLARDALLEWTRGVMAENLDRLAILLDDDGAGAPLDGGYIADFLIDHHAQHIETVAMVLTERALARGTGGLMATTPAATRPDPAWRRVAAGTFRIGRDGGFGFDNESPALRAALPEFSIAAQTVTNAEYLAFMADGGYETPAWWRVSGWAWRKDTDASHPHHWRTGANGAWIAFGPDGPAALDGGTAVHGLSRFEAGAFARWAGARLPHEYEWEAARRLGLLDGVGGAWEWCANPFHPYPGFQAFPYREYSAPWYDGRHFVLRGGGAHTEAEIKRPAFRNFYTAKCRHIFAGLRLAR